MEVFDSIKELLFDANVFKINGNTLVKCHRAKGAIEIPSGVVVIGQSAFEESKVTSVVIPEGVTDIEGDAFDECTKLVSVSLPSTLINIDSEAFEECKRLSDITLNNGLKSIGMEAFVGCVSIASLTIPASVEYIGAKAFMGFKKTQTIIIEGDSARISAFNRKWNKGCKAQIIFK